MSDQIKNTSEAVLSWTIENIKNAPARPGVYILRSYTEQKDIILVRSTDNLERSLTEHHLSSDLSEVTFFDWYETENLQAARDLEKQWVIKFNPKYNLGE